MTESIYVLSDPDAIKQGKYKIGITKRTQYYLLRDYRRSRPEVKLFYFENCLPGTSKLIETEVLTHFNDKRILHESETPSEWIIANVDDIIQKINSVMNLVSKVNLLCDVELNDLKSKNVNSSKEKDNDGVNTVIDFINKYCDYQIDGFESCKDLYSRYESINPEHLSKVKFCSILLQQLSEHYKKEKDELKFKKNNLIHYKGIQFKATASNSSCNII